ncbi:MAG: 1-deoxy-D-xylulose-5-phosphate synthase [Marinilabiliales bacterium]|nr:MAG: 1-deoxy-D-xylulose-5-phosphate synthase [Marinilabiliales bacterium]
MTSNPGLLLSQINSPEDIKKLQPGQLLQLASELREFILDITSVHPGHLGASLGVIELTITLHYIYNTPYDKLIWDVGHQAYAHKILTGRRDMFHTNRTWQGISGFPSIEESEYDAFGTGHSSTSISAALGMATASQLKGESDRKHIAVIGDGAITGGMAFEGFNNAGASNADILVILNDNGISIDKSTGALKDYLLKMATSKGYNAFKNFIWNILGKASKPGTSMQRAISQFENAVKGSILKSSNMFESMNFRYFGPVDGNDVNKLVKVLADIKEIGGPKLLHIITTKGKGFEQAEKNQTKFHAPGKFDRRTGTPVDQSLKKKYATYQEVFGKTLVEIAEKNEKVVAITPAMPTGSSLIEMMEKMPDRVFDVGIAEQHAVTFAAGLAISGMKPFCIIYSTFLQRAYDQLIHDVALQKLPVVFCIDRAGLVGEDGATHQGAFDLAYMNTVPNMIVAAPLNEAELSYMMFTASKYQGGPFSIRYPRNYGVLENQEKELHEIEIGNGREVISGEKIAIVSIGHAGNAGIQASNELFVEGINTGLVDMRFLKPIDKKLLHQTFQKYTHIVTLEDGVMTGGLATVVKQFKNEFAYNNPVTSLGIPDRFIKHGSIPELQKDCGFDVDSIKAHIQKIYKNSL